MFGYVKILCNFGVKRGSVRQCGCQRFVKVSAYISLSQIKTGANLGPSLNISSSPKTLANLSQFFSILSDLKCYRSAFSSFRNHLSNAKSKEQPKKSSKEFFFFKLQNVFFSKNFHFDPSYFISA